ncbi:MAG TPA: SDR family NAD(P)-dependent oxidoreductase [Solirubrobacterales bacterium]|jgi:NAD(P)-dependent dehydrogenase (short-subunit alcohol dehydrogenase family)|nr:SDR family NAD(P)-dependent oxidoreductase [Solirubrobacterales bacterium]
MSGAALIVGGASGIGRACADALLAAGWSTVVADLRPDPDDAGAICVDVRDREGVEAAVERAAESPGGLGAVVYAAGTARVTPLLEIEPGEWDLVLGVNLTGAFNVLRAAGRSLQAGGSFLAISSIDSAAPVAGLGHYCASKAGLEALVRSAALELGPRGIRANAVLPGLVRTPLMEPALARPGVAEAFVAQTPLRGIAAGAEVGDVVAFLVSERARWITGASIPVDGGMALTEHPRLLDPAPERSDPQESHPQEQPTS